MEQTERLELVANVHLDMHERAAVAVTLDVSGNTTVVTKRPVLLTGIVLQASAAGDGVRLFNGEAGSGDMVGGVTLSAAGTDTKSLGSHGVRCPAGLSVHIAGTPVAATALVVFLNDRG